MTVEEAARLTQQFSEALNNRDRAGWVATLHPEFEGYSGLAAPTGGGAYRGHEGAGAWFDDLMEVYETVQATLEQTLVFDDHVLQRIRLEYLGKRSGVRLVALVTLVTEVRDGRFVFAHSHFNAPDALRELAERLAPPEGAPGTPPPAPPPAP